MKAIWLDMDWYRRGLFVVTLVMAFGFALSLPVTLMRRGISYRGEFLAMKTIGEDTVYTGKVDGVTARFTVSPDGILTYTWGEYTYGPYRVAQDPSAAHESWRTGIRLIRDGEVVFRGSVKKFDGSMILFDENGDIVLRNGIFAVSVGGDVIVRDQEGNIITQQDMQEPGMAAVIQLILGPQIVRRGSVGYYMLANLLAALNLILICFPKTMFRLSLWGQVRNVEEAQPSELYIAMSYLQWGMLAAICFAIYWMSVTTIV